MKSKKSVLIIIFSLLLTLAFPIRANASSVVPIFSIWNTVVVDGYYFNLTDGDSVTDVAYYLYMNYGSLPNLVYYPGDSTSHGCYTDLVSFVGSASDLTIGAESFINTLMDYYPNLSDLGLERYTTGLQPPIVITVTPIPTYGPGGGGGGGGYAPTNTPMPLPPLEGDYFLFGVETDNYVHFGSNLPSEVVFAVPSSSFSSTSVYYEVKFSIPSSFVINFVYNFNDKFATSVGVAQSDNRFLSNGVLTVNFYPGSSSNPNSFSVTWEYGYIPTPRPTYTPVPLPQSTPIPTFNPNAPINPDFDYNFGQSVEFGQLPTLFSNVSELSYLFVTPFEFLVTNMWERWYILFLFPIVAIISAFIWERRN